MLASNTCTTSTLGSGQWGTTRSWRTWLEAQILCSCASSELATCHTPKMRVESWPGGLTPPGSSSQRKHATLPASQCQADRFCVCMNPVQTLRAEASSLKSSLVWEKAQG